MYTTIFCASTGNAKKKFLCSLGGPIGPSPPSGYAPAWMKLYFASSGWHIWQRLLTAVA